MGLLPSAQTKSTISPSQVKGSRVQWPRGQGRSQPAGGQAEAGRPAWLAGRQAGLRAVEAGW